MSITFQPLWQEGDMADCWGDPEIPADRRVPGLNLANANALELLSRLDIELDECGSIDAADLEARCMLGSIGRTDDGVTGATYHGERGATIIDCGRRPGYFAVVLADLADIARWAIAHDRKEVQWT